MKKLCIVLSALLISGCSFLEPAKTPTITQYIVHSTPQPYVRSSNKPITLMVAAPKTNALFDTTKIIYSDTPNETNSYAVSRWAKKPSQMLLPLMVQTLEKTRYFRAVVAAPFIGQQDYTLSTHILCLQQVYNQRGAFVKFIVKAQIIEEYTHKVMRQKVFNITQRMPYCCVQSGVQITNRANEEFLHKLSVFTINTIARGN